MAVFAQTSDNDLSIVGGQLVLVTDIAEQAAIVMRNRFLFGLGEYFLDVRQGVPYFQYVFVKNPDVLLIKSLFAEIIRTTPGVKSILSLSVSRVGRKAFFAFRALADNGRIVSGGSGSPFIVEPK